MIRRVIQPPSSNLITVTVIKIITVSVKPIPLINNFPNHFFSVLRTLNQCLTIPNCESEKVINTLILYKTTRNATDPFDAQMTIKAANDINTIPF